MSDVDLRALRDPFPPEVIGKLPRVTCSKCSKGQCDEGHRKIRCDECKSYISERHIHLDYVGHADVTIRLIDVDPGWTWKPQATDPDPEILKAAMATGNPEVVRMVIENAPPKFERDRNGNPVGLWINLTVGGSTKPGVGSCPANQNDAEKVLIGDCLLRGTPVRTDRGVIAIEDIRVGDRVPTREGWRRVSDHWLSHPSAPVRAVLLADGRLIVGTPHHRVPTANRGLQRIDALRNGDMLYTWPVIGNSQVQTKSSGMSAATDGIQITPTGIVACTSWRPLHREITSTSTSTRRHTGQSPKAGTSITATLTRLTTGPKISSPSRPRIMRSGMASIWSPLSGTVTNAASPTRQYVDGAAGVLLLARSAGDAETGLPTFAPARGLSRTPEPARSAEPSSSPRDHGNASALVPVVAVLDAGRGEVWNLSVEDIHEYVANGVVVQNSLRNAAMRFGVAVDLWAKGDRADPSAENPTASAGQAARRGQAPGANGNGNGSSGTRVSRPAQPQAPQPRGEQAPAPDLGDWGITIEAISSQEDADKADAELREMFRQRKIDATRANQIRDAIKAKAAKVAGHAGAAA